MLKIGCHLSSAKGYLAMGEDAVKIGANTFQCFTRNPRGGSIKALDLEDIKAFSAFAKEHCLTPFVAHAPYTLNACSADGRVREFAFEAMQEDLSRLEYLPGNFYNFHPGSHVKQGVETGIQQISELLNRVLTPDLSTTVLLETMSGKGSEVGRSFEELRAIMDRVELSEKLGVCLDTCHVYDAGYDIVQDLDGVLDEFDRIIGLDRLFAIHMNDSKNPFKSHKDRHEKIGEGFIGLDAMIRIINHPKLSGIPICLETPNELDGYAKEIALLKQNYQI
jgi:deoxyribonuclease-4